MGNTVLRPDAATNNNFQYCLAVAAVRRSRLLEAAWDWSSTPSADGGLLNVGGFTEAGLDVLAYSKAVKHGALGICPTLVRTGAR